MHRGDVRCAALAAVALLLAATVVRAHEPGTTQVAVTFQRDATFDITILTDAMALAEKMEAAAGAANGTGESPAEILQRLEAHRDVFPKRVSIAFDGVAVQPVVTFAVGDGTALDPPAATVTLRGVRPSSSSAFRWSYGWTFTAYALRVSHPGASSPVTAWLEGGVTSEAVGLEPPRLPRGRIEIARDYLALGFMHIVPGGLNYVLFALGIFLLSRNPRDVVAQVTAFTIAHALTLALAFYGLLTIPSRFVQPLIAVSIAYLAFENIAFADLHRWRLALVFVFGLLQGLGGGMLGQLEVAAPEFVAALAAFNLGVAAGQLAVIATAFLLIGWSWSPRPWYRARVVIPTSAFIASTAVYLAFVRLWLPR